MKIKKPMIIIASILGLIPITLVLGKLNLKIRFHKQVAELFSLSKVRTAAFYRSEQIGGLPEPVQRYFNHVLKEGQPIIRSIRFLHDGQFKTGVDKEWVNINGEQYVTTEKPGFIWKGTTSTFTARDLYIGNSGRLMVSLFSLVKVVDAKGKKYDEGELIRWLGESVLYPTNLLPSDRLQWTAIDLQSARLTYNYNGLSLFFKVTINSVGEITQLETKRYFGDKDLETWVIKLANYKEMDGVLVPTVTEVMWRLPKGDLSYAKFNVNKIEYNKAEQY